MKIKLLSLAFISFLTFSLQADPLTQPKISMEWSGPTAADLIGNYMDRFMISFESSKEPFPVQYWTGRYAVPHLGVYANQGSKYLLGGVLFDYYQWSPPIILIQFPNDHIWNLIPHSLKKTLISKNIKESDLMKMKVSCYFSLSGNPYYQLGKNQTLTSPKGYNISFHSSVYPLTAKGGNGFPMVGLFQPKGIQSLDIALNDLKPASVYLHEDSSHASSPDNLKFIIQGDQGQFWTASLYDKEIVITYHVIIKNDSLEEIVREISRNSNTLFDLSTQLKKIEILDKDVRDFLINLLEII